MYIVLIFAAALLAVCRTANVNQIMRHREIDNRIEPNGLPTKQMRKFLTITKRPSASYVHEQGTSLELTCDALGSPAPSVHWLKNEAPVFEFNSESNEFIDINPSSIARVSSTLLVKKSSPKDVYTCLITAGAKTASATTVVYTYSADGSTEISERAKLYPLAPRIVVSYKVYMDTIGTNVVLPCRAKGHPRPHVTWRDSKGQLVKNDPRMKVLRSGELVISSLRWTDMGEFSCHAANAFGSQVAKTFVYPAKAG